MTPEQKPFFAGTYFPKTARYGKIGFKELLIAVHEKWKTDRKALLKSADEIVTHLSKEVFYEEEADAQMIESAVEIYKQIYDEKSGGFGNAPKFPTPHNLLFLMTYYEKSGDKEALKMVEHTLFQMYRGGMFDHIGWGFSRYSTDKYFLIPHFEKMLYDNALLILAYCKAYDITENSVYRDIAEKTAIYVLREMTSKEGGFFSAQDADSEGEEGKYYVFEPSEIISILGEKAGQDFNQYFDITENGNFEGKSIPNLLKKDTLNDVFTAYLPAIYEYRKKRYFLHLDDKILTSWNGLMIAAMCHLYRVSKNKVYLEAAIKAQEFIQSGLCEKDRLFVSYRNGQHGEKGFLDEYANEIFSLLALYEATLDKKYLEKAKQFCSKVISDFYDEEQGGFFLYGKENEQLIIRPKETYDGAIPSGNSMMAYNLVQLYLLCGEKEFEELARHQMDFMTVEAKQYPAGHGMFLMALSDYLEAPEKITVVVKEAEELQGLSCKIPLRTSIYALVGARNGYSLKDDRTTFYVCRGNSCLPPSNELDVNLNKK